MFLLASMLLGCQNSKESENSSGATPYSEEMEAKEELKYISETLTGMVVINFSTGEVWILRENLIAFQFGDFYVSSKDKRNEKEENALEMDLLVFYCPKRYGD